MRKSLKKNVLKILSGTLVFVTMMTSPAFAGQWAQDGNNWKYQNDDGSYAVNWQWIDGKSYCFDSNGIMYANTTTPDGYTVNENGEWMVNGVVQTQPADTASSAMQNEEYPLSHLRDWFATDSSGRMCWRWSYDYLWEVYPESDLQYNYEFSHTGTKEIIVQQAIDTRNPLYFRVPTTTELIVIAKLAGVTPTGYEHLLSDEEVIGLEREVRSFLNSFDWKNATDYEKASRIAKRVIQADYDKVGETNTSYSCLANGIASCGGYTGTSTLLALCINLPATQVVLPNHAYPVYFVNGVWIAHEPTTKSTNFTVADYENDISVGTIGFLAEYAIRTGYETPSEDEVFQAFPGKVNGRGGKLTIRFY